MKKKIIFYISSLLFGIAIIILNFMYELYLVENIMYDYGTGNKFIQYKTTLKDETLYIEKILFGFIRLDDIPIGQNTFLASNLQLYDDEVLFMSSDLEQNYYLTILNLEQQSVEKIPEPDIKGYKMKIEQVEDQLYVQEAYRLYIIDLTSNTLTLFLEGVTDFTIRDNLLIYSASKYMDGIYEDGLYIMNLESGEKKHFSNQPISNLTVCKGQIYCVNYNLYAHDGAVGSDDLRGIYQLNPKNGELRMIQEKNTDTLIVFNHHLYYKENTIDETTFELKEKWHRLK